MSHPQASSLALTLALLALPAAAWFEKAERQTWENRLIMPQLIAEPHRHTPLITDGTYLPPLITKDAVYTSEQSPLILTKTTRIAPGVTLTLNPGITIYAHEFAGLDVKGSLHLKGQPSSPIVLASNEQHPLNQTWTGITFDSGSQGTITEAHLQFGEPAITCLPGSNVEVTHSHLKSRSLAAFIASPTCRLSDSHIISQRDGITFANTAPALNNVIVQTYQHAVRQITP